MTGWAGRAPKRCLYHLPDMIRMLLTFLALMSGLAASGAPTLAQAMEPRAVVASRYGTPGAARVSAHVVAHGRAMTRPAQPALVAARLFTPAPAPMVAPVLVGIERARE